MSELQDTNFSRLFKEIEDSLNPQIKQKQIRVLVFGPDLDSIDKPSAKLRKYIIGKCKEDAYTVVLAEHEEIKKLYDRIFPSANDLCKMEYHLAAAKIKGSDIIDGIVIIPDSAGSFIELGMLAIDNKLHRKILVLFDKQHESRMIKNFVGLGAKKAYDNGKARTKILNYDDHLIAYNEVSDFLNFVKSEKIWEKWKKKSQQ
jgi:hypothetical protein